MALIFTGLRTSIKFRINSMRRELNYQFRRPKRVLFDHLPKCAGTTLHRYLSASYPDRLIFATHERQHQESVKHFQSLPQKKRYNYRLILGHSTHELLDFVHPDTVTVTVLRNPIDRIVSHYYHVREDAHHYLHKRVISSGLSLEDYVKQRISGELQNWYTTHFAGLTVSEVEENPEDALQSAARVLLNSYNVVGFQDDFEAAVKELRSVARLGLPYQNKTLNKSRVRLGLNDIPQSTLNAIVETNSVDLKLFDLIRQQLCC